ncbi:hypothetical protein [Ornithinibacillus contaminans]|nr:hypothetical protein [Ornithinibacillus contaminans]
MGFLLLGIIFVFYVIYSLESIKRRLDGISKHLNVVVEEDEN